jgi:hypothetical protein
MVGEAVHAFTATAFMSPQATMMLDHLRRGAVITALYAHLTLGIADTTRCIREIRRGGVSIADEWRTDQHNRRYKAYWLDINTEE